MQKEAAKYGMKIGLKNSLDIVGNLETVVDFAVNEQCAQLGECSSYNRFLALNKPVFHIEYPNPLNAQAAKGISCTGAALNSSTILKNLQLTGETYYCDGSYVNTPTLGGTSPPRPSRPPRPSTSRPAPTPRPSTTRRPSPTPNRPSSTQKPTSTPGGGNGGCRSKHWDQCGGQDWKGCTVCEVSNFIAGCRNTANHVYGSRRIRARVYHRHIIISVSRAVLQHVAMNRDSTLSNVHYLSNFTILSQFVQGLSYYETYCPVICSLQPHLRLLLSHNHLILLAWPHHCITAHIKSALNCN
jgi:hypothetical protein